MELDRDNIFSVSEINIHIKNILENYIPNLLVEGELANFTRHRSGHIYFTLKDENASLRCVFFRSYAQNLDFIPKEGDKVICKGKITVFERAGNYQLNVTKMIPSGIGELQLKFEKLKAKLKAEGLFDESHKKSLPEFPETIGVVTSSSGAAIKDIKNVISRRFPVQILLYPANVQGENAAKDIIGGIKYFNKKKNADVIIIGRGGGSQEDLFCFNDENLAYEIFKSEIPIVSAVGHEIDFTISDFVADLRAPTPSAAAELVVPNKDDILERINFLKRRIESLQKESFDEIKTQTDLLKAKIKRFEPINLINSYYQTVDHLTYRLQISAIQKINDQKHILEILTEKLNDLSPYEALKRGYSIVTKKKKIIKSISQITVNDDVDILLFDGEMVCTVKKKK